jgi:multimeric flavodoxin WrbA
MRTQFLLFHIAIDVLLAYHGLKKMSSSVEYILQMRYTGAMKVIALNGSPRKDGNTAQALALMAKELTYAGLEVEIIHTWAAEAYGCTGCGGCRSDPQHHCVQNADSLNEASDKIRAASGLILGSPTYYGGISGTFKCYLDRLFFSSSTHFSYKVGSSVTVVRRAGGVDVIHQLNNYLQLAEMIIPPTQYWPAVYGQAPGEIEGDGEGIQTIKKNAAAMAWLLKSLDAAKAIWPKPEAETRRYTNFIRKL